MNFISFFAYDTGYIAGTIPPKFGEPRMSEMLGSDATIRVDGWWNLETIKRFASEHPKPGAVGFKVLRGPSLRYARPVTPLIKLKPAK